MACSCCFSSLFIANLLVRLEGWIIGWSLLARWIDGTCNKLDLLGKLSGIY